MQGLGNDFVVVDGEIDVTPDLVRRVCDRRFGVGADGVLQVSSRGDSVHMGYWNADGSAAEMCGNGLRCVARRAVDLGLVSSPEFIVETPIGSRRVRIGDGTVTVELGPVSLGGTVVVDGIDYATVDVGNPHAVALSDPIQVALDEVGPRVEHHSRFPDGTNVEFYLPTGSDSVTMRVWERGVGETLACGTGMVAVASVARASGQVSGDSVEVVVPGGVGRVEFDDRVWLVGPAETVFEGQLALSGPS